MNRDRTAVCTIISKMLDNPDEHGIYPTSLCYTRLINYIEQERAQGIGWMYAQACSVIGKGTPLLEYDFARVQPAMIMDLDIPLNGREIDELL